MLPRFRKTSIMAGLLSVHMACTDSGALQLSHPTATNVPSGYVPITDDSIPEGLSDSQLESWLTARNELLGRVRFLQLGVADSMGAELFGEIAAVQVDPSGRVFILDSQAQEVRVFQPDGTYSHTIGGLGDGPSELRGVSNLSVSQNGDVWVMSLTGHSKVFSLVDGEYLATSQLKLPAAGRSCRLGLQRLIVTGVDFEEAGEHVAHEISLPGGSLRHSFGTVYESSNRVVRFIMNMNGPVACMPESDQVAHSFAQMPIVRLYQTNNQLLWTARVMDYRQQVLVEENGGFLQSTAESYDHTVSLHFYPRQHLLLQHERRPPYGDSAPSEVRSFLIDRATGRGALIEGLPQVATIFPGGYVGVYHDPFPRVEIWTGPMEDPQ